MPSPAAARRVVGLNIAHVKSLGLQHPRELWLDAAGATNDRRFFLVDENDRMVRGAYHGPLVQVQAEYDGERDVLTLTVPDSGMVRGAVERGAPVVASFFGKRSVPGRLVEGAWSAALTEFASRPLRLAEVAEPGAGTDSAIGVSLIARESIAAVADLDARRFRMLIEIAGVEPHEEESWSGRSLRVGEVVVCVGALVARCANTSYDPVTGRRDFDTLRAIAERRGRREDGEICLGVYGHVVQPGRVRLGDAVELVTER